MFLKADITRDASKKIQSESEAFERFGITHGNESLQYLTLVPNPRLRPWHCTITLAKMFRTSLHNYIVIIVTSLRFFLGGFVKML